MAVPHAAVAAASSSLHTLSDVERLAGDASDGIPYEVFLSILAKKIDAKVKVNVGSLRTFIDQHERRYTNGDSLLKIAAAVSLPPTSAARVFLEHHLQLKRGKEVGRMLKNPSLLPNERLRHEVAAAVEADPFCGPHVDTIKRIAGLEYEELLAQKLRALGIPFLTEEQLRVRGDAKTPDVWLPVPLLYCGRLVHWIDSKATFGDAEMHANYCSVQFNSYLHRFDSGLVLYWFGFDESIDCDSRLQLATDLLPSECALGTCMPACALGDETAEGATAHALRCPGVPRLTIDHDVPAAQQAQAQDPVLQQGRAPVGQLLSAYSEKPV